MIKLTRPKSKRGALFAVAGSLLVIAVVGLALVYFLLFPTSSPKPFALSSPVATTPISSGTQLSGSWTIASGSEAGYRVREKLGFLPAQSDAVGRTSAVSGTVKVTQSGRVVTIRTASFKVAVNELKSDRSMRDERIRKIGLESDKYPTATFALSTPVTLAASAIDGGVVHVSATGVFDIHGTSRRETVPLEMTLSDSRIQAVGSLTFPWSEFNMTAPSVGGFVNVTGKATLEFDLDLKRA